MRWLSLAAAVLAAVIVGGAAWPSCEFWPMADWNARVLVPVDRDFDATDELYRITDWQISLLHQNGQYVWDMPNPGLALGPDPRPACCDVTGDSTPDVVIPGRRTTKDWDSLLLYVQDVRTRRIQSVPLEGIPNHRKIDPSWGQTHVVPADLDGDGTREIVAAVASGYGRQPRGVYALDARGGRTRWHFAMGANPRRLAAVDVDDDGSEEIVIATESPGNGCDVNGTSDANNYILCLESDGRLLWSRALRSVGAGGRVMLGVGDIDGDSSPEVIAADHCMLDHTGPDRLWVFSARTGALENSRCILPETTKLVDLCVVDADGNGTVDIATVNSAGRMEIRDKRLEVVKHDDYTGSLKRIVYAGSLIESKQQQFLVATGDRTLQILNHRLQVLGGTTALDPDSRARPVRRGPDKPRSLRIHHPSLTDGSGSGSFVLYDLEVVPKPFPWAWLSASLLGALIVILAITSYTHHSYRAHLRYIAGGLVEKAGIVEMDLSGKIAAVNSYAMKLLDVNRLPPGMRAAELLSKPDLAPVLKDTETVLSGRKAQTQREVALTRHGSTTTYLVRVRRVRFGGIVLSIEDLSSVEYARRVTNWGPTVQRLAHGLKTPLSTIRLTAQQLEHGAAAEAGQVIREEVDRLVVMADGFMRLTSFEPPKLQPEDLNVLIARVVDDFRPSIGRNIHLKLNLTYNLTKPRLHEEQLYLAVINLLKNAVESMEERGGILAVATRVSDDGKHAVIEVADTGPGIPERYHASLYTPFFTSKPRGTGLGLPIVRRIIEDHKGTIVMETETGKGTTFRLLLPIPEEPGNNETRNPNTGDGE